jgi:hypothetical protein
VDHLESSTYAFIVRIWYERREIAGAQEEWRGVIESLASGNRRYVKDLNDIPEFIDHELHAARHALPHRDRP